MPPKIKSAVVKTPQIPPKRRRIKKLHRDLLEQIEFYMSEANLRHDVFMREKAGEKGLNDVPVQLFLSFPLIQEMKVTEKNVLNVVESSRVLELSSDGKHLHRRFPVPRPPHNLDQSTLYIENLPPDTTTEWLKEVCQKIGAVRYVSLPRYKRTGRIKGFAFIEFSSPEEVSRACRIFQDPPKNFFPNRTDKYLKRMNRMKYLLNSAEEQNPVTSTPAEVISNEATPSDSVLNKSLDSAIDFDRLGQDHGTPNSSATARKRKRRRSRCVSGAAGGLNKSDEVTPTHTPAKKLKSLPTSINHDSSHEKSDSSSKDGRNSNDSNTVTMTKKKKQGRKVLFSITEDESIRKTTGDPKVTLKTDNFCQKCGQNTEEGANNPPNQEFSQEDHNDKRYCDVVNGVPCDVKINIQKESEELCDHCNENFPANAKSTVKSKSESFRTVEEEAVVRTKRRRSASEPPGIGEIDAGDAKRAKDSPSWSGSEKLSPVKPSVALNIDELISQGRKQAQGNQSLSGIPVKRVMYSVIAKPAEKKKSRRRSRKSKEQRKQTKQAPPKLSVMPKVQWEELKKEYKTLQKQNMSKLKRTIQENKNAGSVFIKKHLDVLNDINVSNDSINSDLCDGDDATTNKTQEYKCLKRGPPTFQSGVIVRISAIESTIDLSGDLRPSKLPGIEEIKSRLNKYGQGVAYVDVTPGEREGFIRFNDGDSAQRAIMEERTLALCLLTGEHEEQYWERLLASRARKFGRERPKVRGRTKILAKAEALVEKAKRRHIRFDNDLAV